MKINFDGVVFASENKAGIGVVVRNGSGQVIASCSQILPLAFGVEEVEVLDAAKALSFAKEIGFSQAVLESDSSVLIKALADENISLASFGLLVDDVKETISRFNSIIFLSH